MSLTSDAQTSPRVRPLPEIIAHRGASHLAPENTMAAIALAWELDADAVEIDVRLSRDGHIVLHHDATTQRTAGVDRPVAEQTLAELRQLDVGAWKGTRWAGERVPTLDEVLATVPAGKRLFIEIKCGREIVPALSEALKRAGTQPAQTAVIAFSLDVVAAVKAACPALAVYWLASFRQDEATGAWSPTIEKIIADARSVQADGVDLAAAAPLLHPAAFAQLRAAGLPVYTWTVDAPDVAAELVALGVNGITTNRPQWLEAQLLSGSVQG